MLLALKILAPRIPNIKMMAIKLVPMGGGKTRLPPNNVCYEVYMQKNEPIGIKGGASIIEKDGSPVPGCR